MKRDINGVMKECKRVPYSIIQEQIGVIHIGDLEVKIKMVMMEVYEVIGEKDNKGNQVYTWDATQVVNVCNLKEDE